MKRKCKICGSEAISVHYHGKIRLGRPGEYLDDQKIYKCDDCHIQYYDNSNINYAESEYRELIQGNPDEITYYAIHDGEQIYNLEVIGVENLRNKAIADIGCGAGSFLDSVQGITKERLAVEPYLEYREVLEKKGYEVFDYAQNVDKELYHKFDVVSAFAVIEHVDDPLAFIKDLSKLVSKDGYVIISTPNTNDWLLELLGDDYKSFYYRYVHQWYFNNDSLSYISTKLGFRKIEFIYKHKYDLSNLLIWLRDKRPSGLSKITNLKNMDSLYKELLESQGRSNYLYIKIYP